MKLLFCVVLCLAFIGCSKAPSHIRVQNLMGRDLEDVTVMTNSFGALKTGAMSDYQAVPAVFESASVYTRETNGYFRNDRFMGGANQQLASGSYTYVLTLSTNSNLEVRLKKD